MNKICICHNSVKTGQTSVMCCNVCGLPDEDFWQPSPSTEVGQQGEWQLCPKCYGDGHLARYNSPALSTTTHPVCDVCMGAKILAKPIYSPQEVGQDELWGKVCNIVYKHAGKLRSDCINELSESFTLIKK